ncbi:MAG: TerC family protein [Thermoanaerobaculia bacterium]|nr:TerC family protein [Thermoanaerobaculia bacterium]MBP9823975.1 TerC family protein [Thermoanaerobaculia bacterium]
MEPTSLWLWAGFNLFVLAMLAIDLGVFHRQAHAVSLREASIWSAVWIALALVFNLCVWKFLGPQPGVEFLTGYLIEKSLSIDNIFVIALLFAYFKVPDQYQHRVLFWGILGALVMRAAFILAGAALLGRFHWIIYLFGAFLVLTGIKMAFTPEHGLEPEKNPVVRLVRRLMPVTSDYRGANFFVREGGRLAATPLFLVLVMVEFTDLVFAVDSIPAIFAVTRDPFLVYTSNVFAILGLRSLYFLLAGVMHKFEYLKLGLAAILVFVGVKMALVDWLKIPSGISLGVIALILTVAIAASLLKARANAA